jgi:hypothetical protein
MSGQTATTSAARRVLANNAIMLEILNHLGNTDLVSLSPALLPSVAAILYRRINGDIYGKITSSFEVRPDWRAGSRPLMAAMGRHIPRLCAHH